MQEKDPIDHEGRLPIAEAWEEAREIEGIADDYTEPIDRDQAVDDEGKAVYGLYRIWIQDEGDSGQAYCDYTAQEMEAFVETW